MPQPGKRKSRKAKQAVILLHGIGEQIPMETLRGFVDGVWVSNPDLIAKDRPDGETGQDRKRNPVWSKPDERNHSYELHRITTETDHSGTRTDFFEFYWAHLMHGTTTDQVLAWLRSLLLRPPGQVPAPVRYAWWSAWGVIVLVALGFAALWQWADTTWAVTITSAIALVLPLLRWLLPGFRKVLVSHIGDIVRYVEARPTNIARRQEIREQGVALLERLMGVDERSLRVNRWRLQHGLPIDWDTPYHRIVIVGHSLGTIIAYDILKHAFARVNTLVELQQPKLALAALEKYCRDGLAGQPFDAPTYQALQAAAAAELAAQGSPWIISDFIAIGSPLTHAEFLLAKDSADLAAQQEARILPTCPPMMEWDSRTKQQQIAYPSPLQPHSAARDADLANQQVYRTRVPHHAAHFAFTRWTNIHSPHRFVVRGDIISGPVGWLFALAGKAGRLCGARDIAITDWGTWRGGFLTHTRYWTVGKFADRLEIGKVSAALAAVREALWGPTQA